MSDYLIQTRDPYFTAAQEDRSAPRTVIATVGTEVIFIEVAVMAAHESDLPMGLLETIGRLLRDAGRTAQEIDGPAFFRCDL